MNNKVNALLDLTFSNYLKQAENSSVAVIAAEMIGAWFDMIHTDLGTQCKQSCCFICRLLIALQPVTAIE